MAVSVRDFIKHRRDRALGSIMGFAESQAWWRDMTAGQREAFRTKVVDSLNGYHDVVLDLVKAEDGVRNEEIVAFLSRIDQNTRHRVSDLDRQIAEEPDPRDHGPRAARVP